MKDDNFRMESQLARNEYCTKYNRAARMQTVVMLYRAAEHINPEEKPPGTTWEDHYRGPCEARSILMVRGSILSDLVWTDVSRAAEIAHDVVRENMRLEKERD